MPRARSSQPTLGSPHPRRPTTRSTRWGRARLLHLAAWAVLVVAVVLTLMVVTLLVAMRRNDAAIEAHLGTATATVLTVGLLRTGVEFVAADGFTVRPPTGVLYPGLLSPGQKFQVEYSTVDPDLVRVAGRTAAVGNVVIAITLVGIWVVGGSLIYLLRRWSGRPLWGGGRHAEVEQPELGPDPVADLPTARIAAVVAVPEGPDD